MYCIIENEQIYEDLENVINFLNEPVSDKDNMSQDEIDRLREVASAIRTAQGQFISIVNDHYRRVND